MSESVKISSKNYKWLFDNKDSDNKSVDAVIGMLIEFYTKE